MMRKHFLLILAGFLLLSVFVSGSSARAQHYPIEGIWIDPSGKNKMQIYKTGNGTYQGKLVWLKEPTRNGQTRVDHRNPNPARRNRSLLGMVIMTGLRYEEDNDYGDGEVYDPSSGKTYSCKATVNSPSQLTIRGFVGMSLIGKSIIWKRSQ